MVRLSFIFQETSNIFSSFLIGVWFRVFWEVVDHQPFTNFWLFYILLVDPVAARIADDCVCQPFLFHEATNISSLYHTLLMIPGSWQAFNRFHHIPLSHILLTVGHARTNVGCMFIMIGGSVHPILVSHCVYLYRLAPMPALSMEWVPLQ